MISHLICVHVSVKPNLFIDFLNFMYTIPAVEGALFTLIPRDLQSRGWQRDSQGVSLTYGFYAIFYLRTKNKWVKFDLKYEGKNTVILLNLI